MDAGANSSNTLNDVCGIQSFRRDLPWRELNDLSSSKYVRPEQLSHCPHTHAEALSSLFGGEETLRLLVVWVVGG
jgi:hypothetical protein